MKIALTESLCKGKHLEAVVQGIAYYCKKEASLVRDENSAV